MKRYIDMSEISDGRLYELNDMVKADCKDCTGCSACCRGMGSSILLDPYDIWRLTGGLGMKFEELLAEDKIELNQVEGIILPNLKMQSRTPGGTLVPDDSNLAREVPSACGFLDADGRCSIHAYRPGICRLFPLGRYYEDGSFRYFLQTQECQKENRGKVKVWKWIDTPDARRYDQYIADWHYHILGQQELVAKLAAQGESDEQIRRINLHLLNRFFLQPYEAERDFYEQFYERM